MQKKKKIKERKKVGMKVHRRNPLCTLLHDIALVRSIIKAKNEVDIYSVPKGKNGLPQGNMATEIFLHNG